MFQLDKSDRQQHRIKSYIHRIQHSLDGKFALELLSKFKLGFIKLLLVLNLLASLVNLQPPQLPEVQQRIGVIKSCASKIGLQ